MPCTRRVVSNCCPFSPFMPAPQGKEGRLHRELPGRQTNREGARMLPSFARLPAICERETAESRADSGRSGHRHHGYRQSRAGCGGDRARPRVARAGGSGDAAPRLPGEPDAVRSRMRGDARVVPAPRPRVRHPAARTARRPPRPGLFGDFPGRTQAGHQHRHRQARHLRRPLAHRRFLHGRPLRGDAALRRGGATQGRRHLLYQHARGLRRAARRDQGAHRRPLRDPHLSVAAQPLAGAGADAKRRRRARHR